jgi:hypothetical protein
LQEARRERRMKLAAQVTNVVTKQLDDQRRDARASRLRSRGF